MSVSLLDRYGEEYIRNVYKTSNTVEECCEKLHTITKYVGYYAKELGCEEDYKRIKSNNQNPMHKFPDAYKIIKTKHGGAYTIVPEIWIKYVLNNQLICKKAWKILDVLVQTGYKEYKCECCGISEWNGKSIRLQLHHKDGNPMNNNLENLEVLCPNCHTQTDNYGSKNTRDKK